MIVRVDKISPTVLGKEIVKRCGTEGQHGNLSEDDQTTLKFLRAAISFTSNADDMCADLTNAAFIISQPGKEFIIQAGNGDWEFFFSEDGKDVVHGCCVRKSQRFLSLIGKLLSFPVRTPLFLLSQLLNTTSQLAPTNKVQEPTSIVSHPEEMEEETRENHSTDASNLTFSAKLRRLYLYLKGIFAPDTK